jgi:hypothetical protein
LIKPPSITSSRVNSETATRHYSPVAVEHAPRSPEHAAVLADLGPELHGLPFGSLGNDAPGAILVTDFVRRTLASRRPSEMINRKALITSAMK